ncbi:hypothetical protein KGR20_21920 [Cytobacillus oceanisediminis]|uniref:hypothetical protein n=1 Tax=Cytobacillus oceanisediminis TaxID=665099 RepID=UPI001CCC2EE7|nr:hypothetical protein [Cytobacillus oceanisediminis]MBZ9536821.1 hypothetical protein [Cytobacillus oceanisediminis]
MKSIEKFFDMPMGCFCGVLIREKTAKQLAKLLYKHNQEIKELLASDLNQIEVSDWSLAYPEGKQTSFKFYIESSDKEKLGRINLIDRTKLISYCEDGVFIVDHYQNAKDVYMDWYENSKEESK